MADPTHEVVVREYHDVEFGARVPALWKGAQPILAANLLLRELGEDADLTDGSRRLRAYGLLTFFRWAATAEPRVDFWDLTRARVRQYKTWLVARTKLPPVVQDSSAPLGWRRNPEYLERATAAQYLESLRLLVAYWGASPESFGPTGGRRGRGAARRHGALSHLHRRATAMPKIFRITGGRSGRRFALPAALVALLLRWLDEEVRNANAARPALLDAPATTLTAKRRRARARRSWERRKLAAYRDRALVAALLMTGMRVGEMVRVREEDWQPALERVALQERAADADLGSLKRGARKVRILPAIPGLATAMEDWVTFGLPLADKLRAKGADDRPTLMRGARGGPLTVVQARRVVRGIVRRAGLLNHERRISPHVFRHTIATLLREAGVPLDVVQVFLGHSSIETTSRYAAVGDEAVTAAMQRFWKRVAGAAEEAPV